MKSLSKRKRILTESTGLKVNYYKEGEMIKELLLTKLKEYGESLVAKHGEQIVDSYVEKLPPIKKRITKNMIRHIKTDIDNYVKSVKQKQNNPGTIIDVDFTVKNKK